MVPMGGNLSLSIKKPYWDFEWRCIKSVKNLRRIGIFKIILGVLINDHNVFHQVELVFVLFIHISMNTQTFFLLFYDGDC